MRVKVIAPEVYQWTKGETIALAVPACAKCHGEGLIQRFGRGPFGTVELRRSLPCECVCRRIFRICLGRYREVQVSRGLSASTWALRSSPVNRSYSLPREEFCADFALVARRILNDADWRLFRAYHLERTNWAVCMAATGFEKRMFFYTVWKIEKTLGRIFRELQPYPLYPLADYFSAPFRATVTDAPTQSRDRRERTGNAVLPRHKRKGVFPAAA